TGAHPSRERVPSRCDGAPVRQLDLLSAALLARPQPAGGGRHAGSQPGLPVLVAHRPHRPPRATGVDIQHAVPSPCTPRVERRVPRPQLRRDSHRLGPALRQLRRRAARGPPRIRPGAPDRQPEPLRHRIPRMGRNGSRLLARVLVAGAAGATLRQARQEPDARDCAHAPARGRGSGVVMGPVDRVIRHVVAVLLLLCCFSPAFAQPRTPDVIVILADDLGYGDTGVYGSKIAKTPNIDALAASGIRFTDGYATNPVCAPSRAGLMTGRYQQRFGYEFNPVGRDKTGGMSLHEVTLAQIMKSAGYVTGAIGKWHLGQPAGYYPTDRGFDYF